MWPNRQLFVAELEQFVLVFYDVLPHPGAITTRRDEDRGVLDFVPLLLLFRVRTQFEPRHREICWHILPEECLERPDVAVVEANTSILFSLRFKPSSPFCVSFSLGLILDFFLISPLKCSSPG